jgi:hypothetical protein
MDHNRPHVAVTPPSMFNKHTDRIRVGSIDEHGYPMTPMNSAPRKKPMKPKEKNWNDYYVRIELLLL